MPEPDEAAPARIVAPALARLHTEADQLRTVLRDLCAESQIVLADSRAALARSTVRMEELRRQRAARWRRLGQVATVVAERPELEVTAMNGQPAGHRLEAVAAESDGA